jgi:peptidoglycan/xylan/chitin deacetylase (PgdA/CDA1 family)
MGAGTNDQLQTALTFDAGAAEGYSEAIFDYQRDEGIPATFGMTGAWA